MPLQTSGPISLNDMHVEVRGTTGTTVSLNDADVRDLLEKASGATSSFSEFYGAARMFSITFAHTLDNPNPYSLINSRFGERSAISDTYHIVSSRNNADYAGPSFDPVGGEAYIYNNSTGALVHTLTNPNAYDTGAGDGFGYSVAITDTYTIVGAYREDELNIYDSGKAYIFNTVTGALLHTLDNPNANSTTNQPDYFGNSVAISGSYSIVGAYREDDTQQPGNGKAYIFNNSTGALVRTVDNPELAAGTPGSNYDSFGTAVAITDSYYIVGSPRDSEGSTSFSGSAHVYNTTTGALLQTLVNPSIAADDYFGRTIAISPSGNYYVVSSNKISVGGAAYIWQTQQSGPITLTNPNAYSTSANDDFGYSLAINDSYTVVGAPSEDDAGGTDSGKAYIFNTTTGALLQTLDNPNPAGGDSFGSSVAINNSYTIVGGPGYDTAAGGINSGSAYVFNTSTGGLIRTINNPNQNGGSAVDGFGNRFIAISGSYSIVGAYREDDAGGTQSGKAYIFNNSTGALVHTLDNPNAYGTSAGDSFGFGVAITDTYAIVSAYTEDDVGGDNSGKAYIFNTVTGALLHTLDNPNAYNTSVYDSFGYSVGITDTYTIVSAYTEDDVGGGNSGKAYIFNTVTGALLHTLDNPNAYNTSLNDYFGIRVSISDTYAIVSSYFEDDAGGTNSGKAHIFNNSTGALVHTLDNPNAYDTSLNDYFGYSVGITDTYTIVSAYAEDEAGFTQSGKAYIFNTVTGALLHTLDNPNAYGTSQQDFFGYSVAINDYYAIVGAYAEDDAGGTNSGKAYIFNTVTGALLHTLDNPNAYGTSQEDFFGFSVAISDYHVIVGAYAEDDASGTNSGKAYIYDL
jgi:hypothetical protein